MDAANCRCSRVVYVGNIPFHASEQELRDACELIGPVCSLRLAADPATAKRRGYAFVEYAADETARSACRNLHGHLLRGRELRVGLADRQRQRRRGDHEPVGMEDAVHAASLVSGRPIESVTRYLAARSRQELREIVATLESHGADAAEQLKQHVPGLATAMEQVQHLLDMAAAGEELAQKIKKRASESPPAGGDHRAKLSKVTGVHAGVKDSGVPCF